MNVALHDAIADKLEPMKSSGLLSEYLISWVGTADHHDPNVTVWVGARVPQERLKGVVTCSLAGLVPASLITIALD